MAPASPADEWFRRAFDEFYPHLYAHRDESEAETLIRTLRQRMGLTGPVLDVACGPGRFLRALARGGIEAYGLDLSRPLLRQAREHLPAPARRLINADMRWVPVRTGAFAWALLLFTSFGYFALESEDHEVLGEIGRVLRPGGRIVLDFLNAAKVRAELVPQSEREVSGRRVREIRWIDAAGPFLRKRVEVSGVACPSPGAAPALPAVRRSDRRRAVQANESGPVQASGTGAVQASGDGREDLPPLVYEERVRLYTPDQLRELLARAGFEIELVLGDYAGSGFSAAASPRCILVGSWKGEA